MSITSVIRTLMDEGYSYDAARCVAFEELGHDIEDYDTSSSDNADRAADRWEQANDRRFE